MGKIAFVFAGQGDQHAGMGKEFAQNYEAAAAVFRCCDRLRPETSRQCFSGSEEELKETKHTQPCLFAMEMAAYEVLKEKGIRADSMAGFSLGEVAAAAAAGVFDLETGFRLVMRRGALMQEEAENFDTSMAAVLKLPAETVKRLCGEFSQLYPVNFNGPEQITVSGLSTQMKLLADAVKREGGRAIPLKVKAAFHSPFMLEAAAGFKKELEAVEVRLPQTVLYANISGEPYPKSEAKIRQLLSAQIAAPVHWEAIIRHMIGTGIDTFIEIGPGRTLTNMIKKIDAEVKAMTAAEALEEAFA